MPSGPQQVHVGAFEILGGEVGGRSARQPPGYPKRVLVDGCEHQPSHQTWRPLTPILRSVTYAEGKTHVGARLVHDDEWRTALKTPVYTSWGCSLGVRFTAAPPRASLPRAA